MSQREDVALFMRIGGQDMPKTPGLPAVSLQVIEILDEAAVALEAAAWKLKRQPDSLVALRLRLILSEVAELCVAVKEKNLVETADALADIQVVVIGTDLAFGIPEEVWTEVCRSNMAKFVDCDACGGLGYGDMGENKRVLCNTCSCYGKVAIKDPGGKIQKPPGWTPPDIAIALGIAKP